MPSPSDDLTRLESALARAADDLTSDPRGPGDGSGSDDRRQATLMRLTTAAVAHVPGVTYAGLTLRDRDGALASHVCSHPEIAELDRLQAELDEGPCVDVLTSPETPVLVAPDLRDQGERWPRFVLAARRAGVAGLLCFPMAPRSAPPGAITFYATVPDAFDAVARAIARAFATQAAIAVYGAEQVADLTRAVASRDLIGQAKGILMERFGVDDRRAFDLLVRSSQDTNIKLAEVARWLTTEVTRMAPDVEPVVDLGAAAEPEPRAGR